MTIMLVDKYNKARPEKSNLIIWNLLHRLYQSSEFYNIAGCFWRMFFHLVEHTGQNDHDDLRRYAYIPARLEALCLYRNESN